MRWCAVPSQSCVSRVAREPLQVWVLDEQEGYVLAKIVEELPAGALSVIRQKVDATGRHSDDAAAPSTFPAK
jgi:hypothetical protein